MKYDVIIIGAGPGGLFAAYKLAGKLKVAIFEMGRDIDKRKCPSDLAESFCLKCSPCNITSGVGGAGGLSDGKLNFVKPEYPSSFTVGGDFLGLVDEDYLLEKMDEVDRIFLQHGAPDEVYGEDNGRLEELLRRANAAGIEFVPLKQRHVGSDELPKVIKSIKDYLTGNGIEIFTNTTVVDINPEERRVVTADGKKYNYDYLIIGVGRGGSVWLEKWAEKYGFATSNKPKAIDVGVRVEVAASIMEEITSIIYDPKLRVTTKKHDDYVRTFCTCPRGWVIREDYGEFCLVNGHSKAKEKTNNTNFALLGHYRFTEPFEYPNEWGRDLAKITTKLGGGNPIVQRLKDLRLGRRSTEARIKNNRLVQPTLKTAIPGDISLAYPGRVIDDILDALEQLDKVIPGVADDSTLLYAPEIKFYSLKLEVNSEMETNVKDIYAIGDGAGISRGIVGAAVTGLIAAESILKKESSGKN
ncbi:NAD(P)/FAD-dependent oxidoreductase [Archaeoglobus veneficus]|uniref:FAD-dependent pyridine nucleotide-disulfide oxidoreductase n=1 Tax=Archaeoglobus veneficus (strain DSM 11195 / SNP6) TaxID=693661 RepID=F2KS71_ARCVS|nr:NAD(P)/FAD-dependent oxidoreductase [Archaeoglobus veneficus]AEA48010.1 FAD-dependent pyridine nucleotide-disulfide oxidoreductase [Archaeoglobus veneficus SNP6]